MKTERGRQNYEDPYYWRNRYDGPSISRAFSRGQQKPGFLYIAESGGSSSQATHLVGDALDAAFMDKALTDHGRYECIIDFIWYTEAAFLPRYVKLLQSTEHYIGLSSAAVYADSDFPITEDMPRVLDICSEKE